MRIVYDPKIKTQTFTIALAGNNMNTLKVKVSNMLSPRGNREVANQFIISLYDEQGNLHEYFQSYSSIIVHRTMRGTVELDKRYWNYSTTTGKYRNQFLGEGIDETRKKINSGVYKLVDLN